MFDRFKNRPPQGHIETPGLSEIPGPDINPEQEALGSESVEARKDFDPFEFVETNEASLNLSTTTWRTIANTAKSLSNQGIENGVHAAFSRSFDMTRPNQRPPATAVHQAAKRTAAQLPGYTLLSARYESGNDISMLNSGFRKFNPGTFLNVAAQPDFPWKFLNTAHKNLITQMTIADKLGASVIAKLAEQINGPDDIVYLAELYEGGVAIQSTQFAELKRIIRTDWHHPDQSKSALHVQLQHLAARSDIFLEEFARDLAETDNNHLYKPIRNMAKLAIIATGAAENGNELQENIHKILTETRSSWGQLDYLEEAYAIFKESKLQEVRDALSEIAGRRDDTDLRLHPTKAQLENFKSNLNFGIKLRTSGGKVHGQNAKPNKRLDVGKSGAERAPQLQTVERVAVPTPEREPRKLVILKQIGKSKYKSVEVTVEELFDELKVSTDSHFREDATTMIEYLLKGAMSKGVVRLRNAQAVEADGKLSKFWRLDPQAAPRLKVHPKHYGSRVTFATLGKDKLIIHGVFRTHKEFENAYRTSI